MSIYDKASLVLIPSGTKTSKVYSQKPTNGDGDFTFSRSTAATRVNASGNIEKQTGNYMLYSQQIDNAYWNKYAFSVTANQATAPDGTTTADLIDDGTNTGIHAIEEGETIGFGGGATISIHAKYVDTQYLVLAIYDTSYKAVAFDIQNGTIGNKSLSTLIPTIEDLGNGWYRCAVTHPTNTRNNPFFTFGLRDDDVAGFLTSAGSNRQAYVWGAQMEDGLVARDYIETTTTAVEGGITDNVPRLDYTDSSCPALLLEPQRTNHYHQSEYFSTGTRVVIANNSTTSPENVNNATSVIATSVNGSHEVTLSPIISIANTNPRTFSLYAKYNGNHLILNVAGSSTAWTACVFDLQNGVAKTPQNNGSQSACTADIEDAGNGWYRCSVTYTPYASGGFLHLISLTDDIDATLVAYGADEYVGDDVSGIYIYGAQVEEGSYATSYIPTYGSAVTRSYDYLPNKSGMQNFLGTDTGTWFFHINDMFFDITGTGVGSFILTYTGTQLIEVIQDGNDQYKITLNNSIGVQDLDGEDKVAISWSSAGLVIYVNGSSAYTTTSTAYSNAYASITINKETRPARVDLKQMMLFPTRLTNAELATLTTI